MINGNKKGVKIAFLGGDMRTAIAAPSLADELGVVYAWGVPTIDGASGIIYCDSISDALINAVAVVLPLPASTDGHSLTMGTCSEGKIMPLTAIADMVGKDSIIIGGRLPEEFIRYANGLGIKTLDYFTQESFQIENAYTTAEAAINVAMNNLQKNIRGSRFAISGYGRIAKLLSRMLTDLGADVTVAARKDSDLTWATLSGCRTHSLARDPIAALCKGFDVIYNTVPDILFDADFLAKLDKRTVMIELASAPGGIDVSAAKRLHTKVLWAASLPGKYAPESAGALIADCVRDMIKREVGI